MATRPLSRLESVLSWIAGALGALVVASWAVVAAAHVDDAYLVDHVAGTWMALAKYLVGGTLYPPLFDDGRYGGTRYMPLQILLHGGISRITGEYLVAGKLLVYGLAVVLLVVTFVVLRRLGCPGPLALGLVGAVLVSPAGFYDAVAIRGDVLPATLQLAALALVAESRRSRPAAAAGVLCALALLSKLTAVWALVAIVVWLATRDRRRLKVFAAAGLSVLGLAVAAVELASHGRFLSNVLGLLVGPGSARDIHGTPTKLLFFLETKGDAVWLLLPLAALAIVLAFADRRPSIYQLALVAAAVVLVVVLVDPGADYNHLLDLELLTVVVVGELWVRQREALVATAISVVLVWSLASSYWLDLRGQTRVAASALVHGRSDPQYDLDPLDGRIRPDDRVLSEDPYVSVERGRLPVVLDPFMLRRVLARHSDLRNGLVRRIERHEFDEVVLLVRLDPSAPRWRTLHFGPEVARAIDRSYTVSEQVNRYWLYLPRR